MDNPLKKAVSLYNDKKYELALKELLKCDYNLDDNTDLSYYLGLCYTRLKHYDEAVVFLEQVITTHPNVLYTYQCRMILCYIYAVTEQYKLAEFEIKRLIEDGYESAQVFSSYGYIEYQQGRTGKAIEHFREALNLDPEYPNALNSLDIFLQMKILILRKPFHTVLKPIIFHQAIILFLIRWDGPTIKQGILRLPRLFSVMHSADQEATELLQVI